MSEQPETLVIGRTYALDLSASPDVQPIVRDMLLVHRVIYKGKNKMHVNKLGKWEIVEETFSAHEFLGGKTLSEFYDILGCVKPNSLAKINLRDDSFKIYLNTIFVKGTPIVQIIHPDDKHYHQILEELITAGVESR